MLTQSLARADVGFDDVRSLRFAMSPAFQRLFAFAAADWAHSLHVALEFAVRYRFGRSSLAAYP